MSAFLGSLIVQKRSGKKGKIEMDEKKLGFFYHKDICTVMKEEGCENRGFSLILKEVCPT